MAGLALASCADNDTNVSELDGGMSPVETDDADLDGGDSDAYDGDDASDGDTARDEGGESGLPPVTGMPCERDDDCDDDLVCNGSERCEQVDEQHSVCRAGTPRVCSAEHPCLEETLGCDCRDDDIDNDGSPARSCVPDEDKDKADCDDDNGAVHPKATEICDPQDRDEDCNPMTFHAPGAAGLRGGDRDQDGFISDECGNFHSVLQKRMEGDDCDDTDDAVHPQSSEVCNYIDDNCDKLVDELKVEGADPIKLGLRAKLYPDFDQDQYANMRATPRLECDFRIPRGYVFATPHDCDDRPQLGARNHPTAPELCDGADNDCDDTIDEVEGMDPPADFEGTTFECANGSWITHCPADNSKLWCAGDDILQGCARDGTRLKSCRACNTDCQFSCGAGGCDEVVQIAAGDQHACALTREGRVACWGRGEGGRLGNDSTAQTFDPTYVLGISNARGLAAGGGHSCAIVGDARELYCWGRNDRGQLGDLAAGTFSTVPVPARGYETAPRLTGVQAVAVGLEHTCAIVEGTGVICFGQTQGGRLGNGAMAAGSSRPVRASRRVMLTPTMAGNAPIQDAIALALGEEHSCIVTRSGSVECWGSNAYGQLGQAFDFVPAGRSLPVPQLSGVSAISAGQYHTCVVANEQAYCWGTDISLQLGRTEVPDDLEGHIPKPAAALRGVTNVSAGAQFTCATVQGNLACWGANEGGQLGPGSTALVTNAPTPVPLGDVLQTAAGGEYACAVRQSGPVRCWGYNSQGQLGNGSFERVLPTPRPILPVRSANR